MDADRKRDLADRLYRALATGDRTVLDELLHEDFTGKGTDGLPLDLGGEYDSAEAMQRDFWWRIGRIWTATASAEEMHPLDDGRLAVLGTYLGHERSTGAELHAAFLHLLSFQDGRISRVEQLTDSGAWAATLPEPELTTIDFSVDDHGIARVVLDRPEAHNAIDVALANDTLTVARRLADDPTVRVVLITGRGDDFTVGGDITAFVDPTVELDEKLRRMTTPFHEAFRILSRLDAPIVTATRGAVAGGGIGYVYASDISIAARSSRFVTAFADIGLSGDGGWSWHLPRRVGTARAAAITLLNRPVPAEEAERIGLISQMVPDDEFDAAVEEIVQRLAAGPTRAHARMRRLLRESWTTGLDEQLQREIEALTETGGTDDARNAIDAFLERRRPEFEGR